MASSINTSSTVPSNWNVPNALSTIRLILALVVCGLIENQRYISAMVLFIVAASTDWIDGYWARKYNQVTKLGRILDPFVDKIIICGAMIALVGEANSGLPAWVATLVVGRELLITSIRGMIEGQGGDFSAKQLGKWKMVAQCAAIVAILLALASSQPAAWLQWTKVILIYAAVILTVASAAEYLIVAYRLTVAKKT
jgi:CDP-diacylglycerol--glycerol-3-phosphate 3-phosphatidyltransferase